MAPFFWQNSASTTSSSDGTSTTTSQGPTSGQEERGVRHSAIAETTHSNSSSKAEGRGVRHAATPETVHSGPVSRSAARSSSTASPSSSGVSMQDSTPPTSNEAATRTRHAFTPAEKADLASYVIHPNGNSASTANLLSSGRLARDLVPAVPDAAAVGSGAVADGNAGSSPAGSNSDTVQEKKSDQDKNSQEQTEPAATEPEKKGSEEEPSNTKGDGGVNFSVVICGDASNEGTRSTLSGKTFRNQTITNRALPAGARVTDCTLSGCSGSDLRLTDCSFSGCSFADSRITDCSFSGSALSGCRVQDCVFSSCRVVNSRVDGCRYSGSTTVTEGDEIGGIQVGEARAEVLGVEVPPEEAAKIVGFVLAVTVVMLGVTLCFGKYDAARGVWRLG